MFREEGKEEKEFNFGDDEFEMFISHSVGDIDQVIGYVTPEFGREVRTGDINSGIIVMQMIFEVMRLENPKGVSVEREEEQAQPCCPLTRAQGDGE